MRKSPILEALFPAGRRQILTTMLLRPKKSWYLSELAKHLETSPSSLQRELAALTKSGILQRTEEDSRTYFKAEVASPVYAELRGLLSKTAGIVPSLRSELARFSHKIKWAAIYGSVAKGEEQAGSDIDLLIVGPVSMIELVPALQRVERQLGREVNVTLFSESDFLTRSKRHGDFLVSVLKQELITIVGSRNVRNARSLRSQLPVSRVTGH
jgi:predicted nucleotidyltransferase